MKSFVDAQSVIQRQNIVKDDELDFKEILETKMIGDMRK